MLTMVIVFLAYYLLLVRKRSIARKVKNTIAFFILFTLLCVVLWRYYNEIILNVLARFEDNSSAGERLLSWKAGLELWMTDPFLGVGPQNYVHMIAERFPYIAESSRAAHNMYIQSFVEIGLVGFIAFASFLYSPIRNSFRMRLPMEYILGFVSILVMGMTLSTFYEKYVWLYFGLMCNPYLMCSDYRKR
jgi:O-antigen ligase